MLSGRRSTKPTGVSLNSKPRLPTTSNRTTKPFSVLSRNRKSSGARSTIWSGGKRNQGGHHGHQLENVGDGLHTGRVGRRTGNDEQWAGVSDHGEGLDYLCRGYSD